MTMTVPHYFANRRRQRGASMLFALMTLVVLALAAVALIRSVDNASLVAGNLGFKQDATAASARATELAIAYLIPLAGGTGLDADVQAQGYYASSQDRLDPTGGLTSSATPLAVVDWQSDGCASIQYKSACRQAAPEVTLPTTGVKVRWIITRLCAQATAVGASNPCSRAQTTSTSTAMERGDLSTPRFDTTVASPYYRIIVRAQGGRNSVAYTESIVHF
jgi:hypothetical protein